MGVVKTLGKIRRVVCPDCNAKREQTKPQPANPQKCRCKKCEDTRFLQTMFVCENSNFSKTEKKECKCLECTCTRRQHEEKYDEEQTEKAKKRAMIRLRKIYNADMMTEQDF